MTERHFLFLNPGKEITNQPLCWLRPRSLALSIASCVRTARPGGSAIKSPAMKMLAGLLLVAVASFAQIKRPVQEFETTAGSVKITPVQHASLMIEAGGQVIHLDPWSNGNYDGLPPADLILITDIHGDHMDPKMVSKEAKPGSMILAPAAVAETVKNATVIRNGETKTAGPFTIEAVPMYNLKRGPEAGRLVPRRRHVRCRGVDRA